MKFGNFIRGNYIRARIGGANPIPGGARFGKGLRACDQLPFEGFCKHREVLIMQWTVAPTRRKQECPACTFVWSLPETNRRYCSY